MNSLDEKRRTASNNRAEVIDARVVANYGDPGLDEDYHFDILSRFVIVMIESCYRVLTTDKWFKMLAVVQRPRHLWISTNGGMASSPSVQERIDNYGNVTKGTSLNPSIRGISRMNKEYALGETIKIRKLPSPFTLNTYPAFFASDFPKPSLTNYPTNGTWHTQGNTIPYIAESDNSESWLRQKNLWAVANDDWLHYMTVNKLQFEAFNLSIADTSVYDNMTNIFNGTWKGYTPVYSANGGYVFQGNSYVLLGSCEYEDINVGNKVRSGSNDCIPLVVTTPNTFPTPKTRAAGTINYNPTYATITQS